MLCKRAMLMLWHAFMLLGLRFFFFSSFCLVAYATFFVHSDAMTLKRVRWPPSRA
jgi:hypothetical protein